MRHCLRVLICGAVLAGAVALPAQSPTVSVGGASSTNANQGKSTKSAKTAPKAPPGITPEREAAVMTFVQRHHPELSELLIHLKEHTAKEYERAVRELLRTSERLAQIQERDSLQYELELKLWKARSRAQLLAARWQMSESDELRDQLRAALREEHEVRLQILRRDHERVQERAKNLAEQIERLDQRREEEIERQMKQLTAAARSGPSKSKGEPKAKGSAKKKPNSK